MIVTGTLPDHAAKNSQGLALACDGESVTWRELWGLVERHAAWLQSETGPSDSVALDLPNGPVFAIWFLACLHAGREALVFDQQWPDSLPTAICEKLKPALVVSTRNAGITASGYLNEQRSGFADFAQGECFDHAHTLAPAAGGDIFFTGFTSGSTGLPKGYRRSHDSWIASFNAEQAVFQFTQSDCVLAPGALSHSLFLYAFARSIHAGMTCIIARRFNPARVAQSGYELRATVLYAAPSQLVLLLEQAQASPQMKWPPLRWTISSGARWPRDQRQALRKLFPAARFGEFYGSSETSFVSYCIDGDGAPEASSGRLFPGVELRIHDSSGQTLPLGQTGVIAIRSAMNFNGYVDEVSHKPGEWVRTGDTGHLDENGFLFISGRSNRMIVTSGKNLFPEEIETILLRHPAIEQAAVLALPDSRRGEKLVACVKLRAHARCARRGVMAFLRLHLPLYKIPRQYFLVHDWPQTRSQKTAFAQLQSELEAGLYGALP